jgi:Cu/Ag efflux protein CusF
MKKPLLLIVVAMMTMVAFSSVALAEQKPSATSSTPGAPAQESKLERFSGVIGKVDLGGKSLTVKMKNEDRTFALGDQSKIFEGTREVALNDLKPGMKASVEYKKMGNRWVADSVRVTPPTMSKREGTPSGKAMEKAPEKTTPDNK